MTESSTTRTPTRSATITRRTVTACGSTASPSTQRRLTGWRELVPRHRAATTSSNSRRARRRRDTRQGRPRAMVDTGSRINGRRLPDLAQRSIGVAFPPADDRAATGAPDRPCSAVVAGLHAGRRRSRIRPSSSTATRSAPRRSTARSAGSTDDTARRRLGELPRTSRRRRAAHVTAPRRAPSRVPITVFERADATPSAPDRVSRRRAPLSIHGLVSAETSCPPARSRSTTAHGHRHGDPDGGRQRARHAPDLLDRGLHRCRACLRREATSWRRRGAKIPLIVCVTLAERRMPRGLSPAASVVFAA